MKTTKTETEIIPFDARALRALPGAGELFGGVPELAIGVIAGAAIALLAEHPGAGRNEVATLGNLLWERIRAVRYDGDGHTIEYALSRALVPVGYSLDHLLLVLVGAGGIRATLLAQRAAIDAQLGRLEKGGAK